MFAEYEKAQIMERYRRGKAHRARTGSINVLSGAPFGYRYVRKSDHAGAAYEVVEHEAALVAELFRRYADDGASIADLARWLTSQNVPTRTGKHRWDRSVIWGMLRNPAYAGTAVFGKTMVVAESAGLNRVARLQGRAIPCASKTVDRPREQGTTIPVPAIVSTDTFDRVARRLDDNKRFAARNSKVPSLLQGLAACAGCGYGYYRTSTRTTNKTIYYYRCLGSDDYRYEGGRVCANKPVRADYLDQVVWDHLTGLLADPQLIRAEIDQRLDAARTADPVARQRKSLDSALAKTATSIARMIEAYGEQLITIDELRARMPDLRARETNLRNQIHALDAQLADRKAYLTLAADLEGFLAQLHTNAEVSTVQQRQRVLRLLVKDVLIGPDKITIRHRIPIRERITGDAERADSSDLEDDHQPHCPLRWRGDLAGAGQPLPACARHRTVRPNVGDLVRYADDGVVSCGSAAQAEHALAAVGDILAALGLRLHPDKTKVIDPREGREGLDSGCHFRARMSGRSWEQRRIVRYYLHRWPSHTAMARVRVKVRERTGRNRVGSISAMSSRYRIRSCAGGATSSAPATPPTSPLRSTGTSRGGSNGF